MNILVVEDDYLDASAIRDHLKRTLSINKVNILTSEAQFRSEFQNIASSPPDTIIMDVMLRWTDPMPLEDVVQRPSEVRPEGHRAGLRCLRMLQEDVRTKKVPVVIHSHLDRGDMSDELYGMPSNVVYLRKDKDFDSLIKMIRFLVLTESGQILEKDKVFVVHGHDGEAKETVARFLERLDLQTIVLHEQPNKGRTIIEKFETYSMVTFAVILLTTDDLGAPKQEFSDLRPRARQNVVFEFGFFVGKLGRANVCALVKKGVELPSDLYGVLYILMDENDAWRMKLAREMKAAGIAVDLNRIL